MSLFVNIYDQFSKAASLDPSLQQSLYMAVDKEIFYQILDPIHKIMTESSIHSNGKIDASIQLKELRQICNEVQVGHTSDDYIMNLGRNELLNTLQGVLERVEDASGDNVLMDYNDLFALPNLTDVMRGNARIYREFMKSPLIAEALDDVADNIDLAQSRLWKPGISNNSDCVIH